MTRTTSILAALGLFVVSIVGGAFAAGALDGGGSTRVLPATDEPIPVLAPVAAGPDAPPFPTATGGGGSGGSGGGAPAPSTASVVEPVSTDAPTDLEDPDLAGLGVGGDPGDPVEPLIDVDGGRVLRGPHFEDPCSLHGSIDCGARSIPGTILGGDADDEGEVGRAGAALDDPPPLWVQAYPGMGPGGPLSSRCPASSVAPGEAPVTVLALNPVDITVEWREFHYGPPEPTLGTLHISSAGASDPERRRWQGWFDDGTLNSTIDHRVQHCFGIAGLDRLQQHELTVSATDIFGQTDTDSALFFPGPAHGRPPTIVTPVDDGRFAVRAARRSSPLEQVDIRVFPATGDGAFSGCNAAEAAGAPGESVPGEIGRSALELADDAVSGTSGYFYDPPTAFSVHEGTRYWICLWWSEEGARSFDPRRITGREWHSVTSPNHYGVRIGVEGVSTNRDIDAGGIGLEVLGGRDRLCHSESTRALTAGDHDDFTLDVCRLDDGTVLPSLLGLRVTGPHGRTVSYGIDVPEPCTPDGGCAPTVDQWYELTIPNEVAVRRLCMGSCDPPSRRERAGTAHVHAEFVDGASDGGTAWDVGSGPDPFSGVAPATTELPPWPRLDQTGSQVIVVDAHTLRIVWNADRPVVVHGAVTAYGGGAACLRSGDGTFTTTDFATNHVNEIGGLCANTRYEVVLDLTGGAGETLGYGPGRTATWSGQLTGTPGFSRRVQVDILFDAPPGGGPDAEWHGFGFEIDGIHGFVRGPSGCTPQTSYTSAGPSGHATLGDVATIEWYFQGIGPCISRTHEPGMEGSTRFTQVVSIEDLDRGVTLESPAGDTLTVHVTIHTMP